MYVETTKIARNLRFIKINDVPIKSSVNYPLSE